MKSGKAAKDEGARVGGTRPAVKMQRRRFSNVKLREDTLLAQAVTPSRLRFITCGQASQTTDASRNV